ncbi:hypothetical protein [Mycobacterium sp. DL440]|uniref:hypothetical protein n=1 Tax=Mycobacterium sp. DL440 TaxID=2675523 RepID=UPI00142135D2|nr:hypothetical protein [Mycobacterium sp. DL440]
MDAFDRQMVQYVLRWAPFGGPRDEDTFCEFGLTSAGLYERMAKIVGWGLVNSPALSIADRRLIMAAWTHQRDTHGRRGLAAPRYSRGQLSRMSPRRIDPAQGMEPADRRLLHYVLAWAKFEGPPEDEVFGEFRLSIPALYERFAEIVVGACTHVLTLPDEDRDLVHRAQLFLGWHAGHARLRCE